MSRLSGRLSSAPIDSQCCGRISRPIRSLGSLQNGFNRRDGLRRIMRRHSSHSMLPWWRLAFGSGALNLLVEGNRCLSYLSPVTFLTLHRTLYVGRRLIISEHGLPLASRRFGDIKRTPDVDSVSPPAPCSAVPPSQRSRLKNSRLERFSHVCV